MTLLSISRGTVVKVNDAGKMQTMDVRGQHGDKATDVEHWHPFGFSSVPLTPKDGGEAEVLVTYVNGHSEHPVVVATADRRHRPKNLKSGESAHHDDQGQISKIGRDGIQTVGKKVEMTAGSKPATSNFELNEQMKGLAARVAQAEKNLHGLFDVTSRFRQIVQGAIPGVAALAPILNQNPSGLNAMAAAISGTAEAYLQAQVTQALQLFLNPNLAALASVLSGAIEAQIATAQSQIAALIAANPVVSQVDNLREELTAMKASRGPTATAEDIGRQIAALLLANPIVKTVDQARIQLQSLVDAAGPGLNFLEPQKRLVQGKTRSMQLS